MIEKIETILFQFQDCFSNKLAFNWLVIIIAGFIIRFDHHGVSSVIRWLFLDPKHYNSLCHFFRTKSWNLEKLLAKWTSLVLTYYPLPRFNGRLLVIGDGIKICKESAKMPGVKKLHQNSENSGKGTYIFGHHFNFVGILVGNVSKFLCLPLHGQIHEGIDGVREDEGIGKHPASIVTRMAWLIVKTVQNTGQLCYVAVDSYFSTGPMFLILKTAVNEKGEQIAHIVTRAKKSYVAFFDCNFSETRFHDNDKFKLIDWFESPELFNKISLTYQGQIKTVEYYCNNYLWKPVGDFLRFVWIKDGDDRYILMSSDLNIPVADFITIYMYRSKIETMFLFLKHLIGGFCYHFWTKVFPKISRKEELDYSALHEVQQDKIVETVEAIERFVNLAGIAFGLLGYLALNHASEVWEQYAGWLRTSSSSIPSEGVVQSVIQAEFFSSLGKVPNSRTLQIIARKKRE